MAFARVLSLEHPVLDFSCSPSFTRQEFLADSDINRIVDRFLHTGVLPQPNLGRPSVDGLDSPGDFTEACDMFFAEEVNDVPQETPQETLKETPQETLKETPKETSKETPKETPKE